jgi:iron-sulfur cluster assembly accessory protein|tara:strand:- start:533 stop:844 length:312 start_codon:yes stop_codon:yes gene_type:complete
MLTLTPSAKEYLGTVKPQDQFITLSVDGGGCAGFQYKWATTDTVEVDKSWGDPIENILLVDPIAEMYIIGSVVDYKKELGGSYLTVKNPGATSSCGCGESFGV